MYPNPIHECDTNIHYSVCLSVTSLSMVYSGKVGRSISIQSLCKQLHLIATCIEIRPTVMAN